MNKDKQQIENIVNSTFEQQATTLLKLAFDLYDEYYEKYKWNCGSYNRVQINEKQTETFMHILSITLREVRKSQPKEILFSEGRHAI